VQLQPYVLQMIDRMAEWFNDVSGSQDVTRGANPSGVTAYKAISALQEAAQTRIRQKQRNLDVYLQQVGQQYASRLFQFKTAPEIYRLTGMEGAQNYFKMHVEDYEKTAESTDPITGAVAQVPTGETGKRVVVQHYAKDANGRPTGMLDPTQLKVFEMRGKMDVRVSTGSSLPFAKDEKEQKLLAFFDKGIIDEEEVLKGAEYPNWQAVLQRVEQKKQAAAQAEMAAKGGAPAPAPAA